MNGWFVRLVVWLIGVNSYLAWIVEGVLHNVPPDWQMLVRLSFWIISFAAGCMFPLTIEES